MRSIKHFDKLGVLGVWLFDERILVVLLLFVMVFLLWDGGNGGADLILFLPLLLLLLAEATGDTCLEGGCSWM